MLPIDRVFQPTLPARGATGCSGTSGRRRKISTHAPRTGSDEKAKEIAKSMKIFQPTLPARGATANCRGLPLPCGKFQPTLPARGATFLFQRLFAPSAFQPTLPARGATRGSMVEKQDWLFQPTLPARGATRLDTRSSYRQKISTHAPRTGSDPHRGVGSRHAEMISTHAPRTGSDMCRSLTATRLIFQPTLPARGATRRFESSVKLSFISTHAPRTGSDLHDAGQVCNLLEFQPTLPARGATSQV